jgi:hypothetical protein
MKIQHLQAAFAASAITLLAVPAIAQERTLQFDVNNAQFQARSVTGAPAMLSTSFTGSLTLGFVAGTTTLDMVAIRNAVSGDFQPQPFAGSLTGFNVVINLVNGFVDSGEIQLVVSGGDSYVAGVSSGGGGRLSSFIGGGFFLDGLTFGGQFTDADFQGVAIPDFFANQQPNGLPGSFFNFKLTSNPQGGNADIDIFVTNIPSPGSLALVAAGGGLIARRRRR